MSNYRSPPAEPGVYLIANYVRKSNCPLIVRTTSEDLLTANVFGILKNLDPTIWLRSFLGEAIKGKDFSRHTFGRQVPLPALLAGEGHNKNEISSPGSLGLCLPAVGRAGELHNLSFEFWKRYRPPVNRKYREGISEVDVTISYKDGIIFIEAKYLAPVSLRTSNEPRRDQVIRYRDLAAYHFLNHPDTVKEFYFVLIMDTEKPPWVLTRYQHDQNLIKGLTPPGLFRPPVATGKLLSKNIGWLTWKQLRKILELVREQFRDEVERKFVDDLIVYLDYKIREAERIRYERKQMSFW
ncbi:MAG: hypothetical protein FJ123_12845 [Deltaproteobacteria bacterium]|nr:hypothetical protein [Deltaproteobacteria bacterium]